MRAAALLALLAGCSPSGILVEVDVDRGCVSDAAVLQFAVIATPSAGTKSAQAAAGPFFAGDHRIEIALPDGTVAVKVTGTASEGQRTVATGELQLPIDGAGRYTGSLLFAGCGGDGPLVDLATTGDLAISGDLAMSDDLAMSGDLATSADLAVADLAVAPDLAPPSCELKGYCRIFVSSLVYNGNLGGLAGADAKCQALANGRNLGGTFKAWLSDSNESPSTRFHRSAVPYRLVDQTLIANDWAALTATNNKSLANPINKDETGAASPSTMFCGTPTGVWSNTSFDGKLLLANEGCSDFTMGMGSGQAGNAGLVDTGWTNSCGLSCNLFFALYCVEQ